MKTQILISENLVGFYDRPRRPSDVWDELVLPAGTHRSEEQRHLLGTVKNRTPYINFLTGIQGVASNGKMQIQLPIGRRYFRVLLQPSCVNYTGGVARTPTIIKSAAGVVGTGTISLTVANGVVTGLVGVAGTSATFANGDTITVPDPTGQGVVLTNNGVGATLATGNWAVTVGGTPSPCNPGTFFTGPMILTVNGTVMRDIPASDILAINQINGKPDQYGILSIHFVEPWRKDTPHPNNTAWDLTNFAAGSTFTIESSISGVVNPQLAGQIVFDFQTTTRMVNGVEVPITNPITQHRYPQQLGIGFNSFTQIPHPNPMVRIWTVGATPGNIYQQNLYMDTTKYQEATQDGSAGFYGEYGFTFNQPANSSVSATPTNNTNTGAVNANIFDIGFISDPDQRLGQAVAGTAMELQIYSNIAQTANIIIEAAPGKWSG